MEIDGIKTLSKEEIAALQLALPNMSVQEKLELMQDLEVREARTQLAFARSSVLGFANAEGIYPGFKTGPHHKVISKLLGDVVNGTKKRVILNVAPRFGKLLADDTAVLTANKGWVTHGDLCVGDFVFHPSGRQVEVLAVSGKDAADVRVDFFDGSSFYCHENHEWSLYSMSSKRFEVKETRDFLEPRKGRWGRTSKSAKQVTTNGRALHFAPLIEPLQYAEKELPLHPYMLGVWLGDGSSGKPHITHAPTDVEHIAKLVAIGYVVSSSWPHKITGVRGTSFGGTVGVAGRLTKELQDLGIYTNKRIPKHYLQASVAQRLELLAGLIDTDGYVDRHSRCKFINANRGLIEDVRDLVTSFGWRVSEARAETTLSSSGIQGKKVCWTLSFQPTLDIPVALPRKKVQRFPERRRIGLSGVTRDPQGKRGHCIQVDSPDGLYLVGKNLVPTHNSELSSYLFPAYFLGKFPDKKIIMATHTAKLSEDFGRKVRNLVGSEEYQKIFPATKVADDQSAAGKWSTSAGGQYYAAGVGGALAGRGADLFVIDDPHALTLDTEVATIAGFKTIAQIEVGDFVFAPDGSPVKVVGKSDVWHDRDIYEVTTVDGAVVECDGGHLWTYRSDTKLKAPYRTATARELADWDKKSNPCIPRHAPVEFPKAALPVDPYVLGAWLGNGTAGLGRMTAHLDDVVHMKQQFTLAGYTTSVLADPHSFSALGLRKELFDLGVRDDKHVPEMYLTAAIEQRMALLQGFMDTDGHVSDRGQCSFSNTNVKLARAVQQLVHSMGVRAKIATYHSKKPNNQPLHVVTFTMDGCFRSPRKVARCVGTCSKRSRGITVKKTDRKGSVQCITVANADGLFLVGRNYVVTHNSEQDVKANSRAAFDSAWAWFQTGPLQRLMPGGSIIVIATRWGTLDITGRLIDYQAKNPEAEPWEVIELPAILDEGMDDEKSLWPEQWPLASLKAVKASLDPQYWNAQYMQNPTSNTAAIISRKLWRFWPDETPPDTNMIIQVWDTAYESKTTADFSACQTWGVWFNEEDNNVPHVILLNAFKARMQFPELKATALKHYKEWAPDCLMVEKKASGAPLIQELRSMGLPVQEFTPSRGNDKTVRLNAVADFFASGRVWVPDTRWAREVIDEVASYPNGTNDDYVDCTSMALLRLRQGGLIGSSKDEPEERQMFRRRTNSYY